MHGPYYQGHRTSGGEDIDAPPLRLKGPPICSKMDWKRGGGWLREGEGGWTGLLVLQWSPGSLDAMKKFFLVQWLLWLPRLQFLPLVAAAGVPGYSDWCMSCVPRNKWDDDSAKGLEAHHAAWCACCYHVIG